VRFPFHLVMHGRVAKTVHAPDIDTARRMLGWVWYEGIPCTVVSAASYATPLPKPLADRVCRSCGIREQRPASLDCLLCDNARRRAVHEEAQAAGTRQTDAERSVRYRQRAFVRAKREAWVSRRGKDAMRNGSIAAGIARRKAKRERGVA
jgi:hypothetical protein